MRVTEPSVAPLAPDETIDADRERGRIHLRIGSLLHDVSRLRRRLYEQRAKPLGLTRSRWWALFHLSRFEEPPHQAALAQLLDIGTPAAGDLVERLERDGFVRRTPDPRDRRAIRIHIVAAGRAALRRMADVAQRNNEQIMKGFTTEEVDVLLAFLEKMKANLLLIADGREPEE